MEELTSEDLVTLMRSRSRRAKRELRLALEETEDCAVKSAYLAWKEALQALRATLKKSGIGSQGLGPNGSL